MTTQQSVVLGSVTLRGFEVPEQIVFGGGQRLAVHELIGGGRVIDTLGAAAEEIEFSGVFSGPDAALRVQSLDVARAAGLALPLSWGDFSYSVIIASVVQAGLDIASAIGFAGAAGVSLSSVSISLPVSFVPAVAGLAGVIGLAGNQLDAATANLAGNIFAQTGVTAVLSAAGASALQANALAAQAYLGRAAANVGAVGA
ncbi:MAG: hypothetical protein B7X48_02755 [Acidiphilium sp. 34-60-192]|nr:MAG: hypothetical protein B7X48_02755 [Acidiphilium sp. 34-60-192]